MADDATMVDKIRSGYGFTGPALDLGALVTADAAHPDAPVRIPLGRPSDRISSRAKDVGQQWTGTGYPVEFLSLGGQGTGVPIRVTVTSFGPPLLSKVLGLNETQESSLGLVFHYADKAGLPLLDLNDLRAVIAYLVSDEGQADLEGLGGLAKSTAGVILRELIGF